MNGRKSKNNGSGNSKQPVQSFSLEWCNVPLTDQDRAAISEDTVELELLASALIGLVGNGYGCSCKYQPERGTYNCSLYRPGTTDKPVGVGISSFAPDIRLAICITLYKFNFLLGGELPERGNGNSSAQSFG